MKKKTLLIFLLSALTTFSITASACSSCDKKGGDDADTNQTEGNNSGNNNGDTDDTNAGNGKEDDNESDAEGEGEGEGEDEVDTTLNENNKYTVKYISNGAVVSSKEVAPDTVDSAPVVTNDGYYFGGWYTNSSFTGSAYDTSKPVSGNFTLYAKWLELDSRISYSYAGNEAAAFEWKEANPSAAKVAYKLSGTGDNAYTQVDAALIRESEEESSVARVDVVGLKGNAKYDFKITTSSGAEIKIESMSISAYDRSGYAHFNYTSGVGAYNDDGTLKDGALVIYLTNDNKNDLTLLSNYAYCNGESVDISKYFWNGYKGIGYLLNNRQYGNNTERRTYGIQALTFDYDAVAIRIIGKVNAEVAGDGTRSEIEGLTAYDSTNNGGSTGDNGRMARITNAKNLTIEGVGTNAQIYGWGIHFVSNDNLHLYEGSGESFEVRNITFANYPEDAIGMEGTQGYTNKVDSTTGSITGGDSSADAELISPVERCWIHHNSFLPGYCAAPAESDKAEGDGSCDFKRGQYYTLSYNYFTDCHKTNLIGSAQNSLTYNVTMHHNWWNNCGSRQPLARRANIHYYNNYISCDISSGASLSYIISARAYSYIFVEANYFEGCKQVANTSNEGGGAIKAYNNTYYACFNTDTSTKVSERDAVVSNSCKFIGRSIDYSSFDTNSDQFYYNAESKISDCYLTSSETARAEAILYAGVLKRDYDDFDTKMNKTTPANPISIGENGLTVKLAEVSKGDSVVDNVAFTNVTSSSNGTIKGKGQIATFTLASEAAISVTGTASASDYYGELVDSKGTVYASKFTTITDLTLPAGTYFIASGEMDKEFSITSLSFKDGVSDSEKIQNAIDAIDNIGEVTLTEGCYELINRARGLYNSLSPTLQAQVTNSDKLTAALDTYYSLQAEQVIALIDQIGTVSVENSYRNEIIAAREAYDGLDADAQSKVTNYAKLTAAEADYEGIAITVLSNTIDDLSSPSGVSYDNQTEIETLLAEYRSAYSEYLSIEDEDLQARITTDQLTKLTNGIAELKNMLAPFEFKAQLATLDESNVTLSNGTTISSLKNLLNSMTDQQKALITSEEMTKYDNILSAYTELASKTQSLSFTTDTDNYYNDFFTVTAANTRTVETVTVDGVTYTTSVKMETNTSISFTTEASTTLTLYFYAGNAGNKVIIDGTSYTIGADGTVTVALSAGDHEIKKDSTNTYLFVVMLSPAA